MIGLHLLQKSGRLLKISNIQYQWDCDVLGSTRDGPGWSDGWSEPSGWYCDNGSDHAALHLTPQFEEIPVQGDEKKVGALTLVHDGKYICGLRYTDVVNELQRGGDIVVVDSGSQASLVNLHLRLM